MTKDRLSYYCQNAAAYIQNTLQVDMTSLYQQFLPLLPAEAHILDAGCGSGRDSLAFREQGFRVTACDASPTLAEWVTEQLAIPVEVIKFQAFDWHNQFDGIWACASLLHVPEGELPLVLNRLSRALKPHGVLYLSFKYGQGERVQDGRHFTDLNEARLDALLESATELSLQQRWVTCDQRPERHAEQWLNALVRKRPE
jgi:SAM-dependent methyltransferase